MCAFPLVLLRVEQTGPQTVVPKQVATLAAMALKRLSEKFQAPAAKAKADVSFSDIAAKRARVG